MNDFNAAFQYFQNGNIYEARKLVDNRLLSYPRDVNTLLLSAAISASESDFTAVVDKCRTILEIDPLNIRAYYNAAVASEKLNRPNDVSMFATGLLELEAGNVPARLLLAGAVYDTGDHNKSLQLAYDVLSEHKGNTALSAQIKTLYGSRNDNALLKLLYDKLLREDAGSDDALYNLVLLHIKTGDLISARKYVNRLTANSANGIYTVLANSDLMIEQGSFTECIEYLSQLPDMQQHPEVLMRKGRCHGEVSEYKMAIQAYMTNITSSFRTAECYHCIGMLEDRRGNYGAAIRAYRSALETAPSSIPSMYNLAFVYFKNGDRHEALDLVNRCYQHSDTAEIRQAYVELLSGMPLTQLRKTDEAFLTDIIADENIEAHSLSSLATELLLARNPAIDELVSIAHSEKFEEFMARLRRNSKRVTGCRMLRDFYCNIPITTWKFEKFSTFLRRGLLRLSLDSTNIPEGFYELCAALAIRCYISGYIFLSDEIERRDIQYLLKNAVDKGNVLSNETASVIAMYMPLYEACKQHGLRIPALRSGIFGDLFKLQYFDPVTEERLMYEIECPVQIDDSISQIVRNQYEGNPYPVWINLNKRKPEQIASIIRSIAAHSLNLNTLSRNPDILVAGCGTGSHAIQTAMRIVHNSLTAIDLSKRSLAFAMRKAVDYDMQHIDFKQLDILNVSGLERKFDIIESVGVLHHMRDPSEGLGCLVDILKPDGVMNIGLYSETGRRYVIRAKSIYDDPERRISDDEIRESRPAIMNSDDRELAHNISSFKDFYSLHECRDLIFHENEHNYNMDSLASLLESAGLEFLGFELNNRSTLTGYRKMFPEDDSMTNLCNWKIYEEANPDTFSSMYVFWCRKK